MKVLFLFARRMTPTVGRDYRLEHSSFWTVYNFCGFSAKNDAEADDIESKIRKFPGTLDDDMRELLPIKVGTKVIRQTCKKDESSEPGTFLVSNLYII